jgi:peptide/nickel transport system permease protein
MTRFILRRLALSIVTLFILLVIIFSITNVFPGDPARAIAGPLATEPQVEAVRERIGSGDPLREQFGRLLEQTLTFFDGVDSFESQKPVRDQVLPALGRSSLLVLVGLTMTVPLSIFGGLVAARRKNTTTDRAIVTLGLASSAIPDFVSGVILQYVIGVKLGWFPALADAPSGSGILTTLEHLVLPGLTIVVVYFGYIARITRAGAIESMESDYARTAALKGLSNQQVVRGHVLRNALQPTVAVVGTQMGYLFGGLVGIEVIFDYSGLGGLIVNAATGRDLPLLQAGVIVVAVVFMLSTLMADLLIAWMNPRTRLTETT